MIIDISKYQSKIEWPKVKGSVGGVYIKATEGLGYIDPSFKKNVIGASSENVPIGFYHFASLNSANVIADSAAEARAFYEATKGYKVGLPYVLDIERNDSKIPPVEVLKWIQNFFLTLHTLGVNDVALYSYTPFLNTNLPVNHTLGDIKLWLAAYVAAPPKLPKGWKNYWLWQYSSKGQVPGIFGNVDLNKYL